MIPQAQGQEFTAIKGISTVRHLSNPPKREFVHRIPLNRKYDIDALLLYLNRKLDQSTTFSASFFTNEYYKSSTLRGEKRITEKLLYVARFFLHRVLPKLTPSVRRLYLKHTVKRDKHFTKTEVLGRLYKYGFSIVEMHEVDHICYFTARKVRKPDIGKANLWPIFAMKRVGRHGKMITVFKLRTMHVYSEYLQEYIYQKYGLANGDKFNNDFRISFWGKWLRKYWLDEVPMIFNLFRGDMKLIGPRPLTRHKFSLYTTELQQKRTKYKPGLFPPFYADMPDTLEGLMASEIKYLDTYEKKGVIADFIYLFKIVRNIVFRKARSN